MKVTLRLNTETKHFVGWLKRHTRDVAQRMFSTEVGRLSVQPARLAGSLPDYGITRLEMEGIQITSGDGADVVSSVFPVIAFSVEPLSETRITIEVLCFHLGVEDYVNELLTEVVGRWPEASQQFARQSEAFEAPVTAERREPANHDGEEPDCSKIYVPSTQTARRRWEEAYEIIVGMRDEYQELYDNLSTHNPTPSIDDIRDALVEVMRRKPSSKTVGRIIKAGDADCL